MRYEGTHEVHNEPTADLALGIPEANFSFSAIRAVDDGEICVQSVNEPRAQHSTRKAAKLGGRRAPSPRRDSAARLAAEIKS